MPVVPGCLKPTNVEFLPRIWGIVPPPIRRSIAPNAERTKMECDPRHVMFGQSAATQDSRLENVFQVAQGPLETTFQTVG